MSDTQHIAVVGDIHGHLQLALSACALLQQENSLQLSAILFCGDVGTFTSDAELDSTTRAHAKRDPAEVEFLRQWSSDSPPPWLDAFFTPREQDGLGISCPLIMVHGNHEGFERLAQITPPTTPARPVSLADLPFVDTRNRLRYLPSGWRIQLETGLVVAGVGGIERGQRQADYHELAYIEDEAVLALMECEPGDIDILLTHQGPHALQGRQGATDLDLLLDAAIAQYWFHGHSVPNLDVQQLNETTIVPLQDLHKWERGHDCGLCLLSINSNGADIERGLPKGIRTLKQARWWTSMDGDLVSPLIPPWPYRKWTQD